MALIELKNISRLYGFGDAMTLALDEVELTIDDGEFVAIMGPSGSGKSTLMNLIGMLDSPTHGSYSFAGRDVSRLTAYRRARIRRDRIGFIFQSQNLLPRLTVLENVALPLSYRGMSVHRQQKRATELLDQVGLPNHSHYFPHQLSGGQAQSVAIARALVNKPELIIADEPTGNLDSAGSRLVMELLAEINRNGNTILMVTHNPELTRYASRVVYMRDGMVIHDEETLLGEVAKTAKKQLTRQYKTAEDDVAGVSALMGIDELPGGDNQQHLKASKKSSRKRTGTKSKPKTSSRSKTSTKKKAKR